MTHDDLVAWLGSQEWAAKTKLAYRAALRSLYGWSHETGRIPANPAAGLPPIKSPVRKARPTPELVLAAALLAADPRIRLMVLLAAREGLRRGEIGQVPTRDLEQDSVGDWSLRVHGKGDKERMVPLCDEVRVLPRTAPQGYLFPGLINGHLSPGTGTRRRLQALVATGWSQTKIAHQLGMTSGNWRRVCPH